MNLRPPPNKDYFACPKKLAARWDTIIHPYRALSGLRALPKRQQYWTLPGKMVNDAGVIQSGCELLHMVREGLLRHSSQFYGVEADRKLFQALHQAVPEGTRLYHGELFEQMLYAYHRKDLRPGIVHLDTLSEPRKALDLFIEVVSLLNHVPGPTLLVLNCVMDSPRKGPHRRYAPEFIFDLLADDPFRMEAVYTKGWSYGYQYRYNGTGASGTKMQSIVYHRGFSGTLSVPKGT
jgi:hypothetical protein